MYRKMLYALIELQFNLDFNFLTFKWDAKTMSIARLLSKMFSLPKIHAWFLLTRIDWIPIGHFKFEIVSNEIGLEKKKPYIAKIKTHGLIFCHYAFYIPVLWSSKQQMCMNFRVLSLWCYSKFNFNRIEALNFGM